MDSLLLLRVVLLPSVQALFTVEVANLSYLGEFGQDITLECRFAPVDSEFNVSVVWHRILPKPILGVYCMLPNGQEDLGFQSLHYRGRVQLLKDELKAGRSLLKVSDLRINDTGTYQCLVEMLGADYKQTTLTVKASYKPIKKGIKKLGEEELELSCESEGYPLASIFWTDGKGRTLEKANFTNVTSSNLLYHITSRLAVKDSNNSYRCTVMEESVEGPSANFIIPEEVPGTGSGKPLLGYTLMALFVVTLAAAVAFLLNRRKKGIKKNRHSGIKTCLIQDNVDAGRLRLETTDDMHFAAEVEEGQVEHVRKILVNRYTGPSTEAEAARLKAFCDTELPRRLHNSDGLSVDISTLLPGAGETVLLEGGAASGKTSVALSLASFWAQSFDGDPFGVSKLPVLVLVTCDGVSGNLFYEAVSQTGLEEQVSLESLRALLTGPTHSLLIMDGYSEGCKDLDKSLASFLRDRQMCRVLVTARPSCCPALARGCGTVLDLHHPEAESQRLSSVQNKAH